MIDRKEYMRIAEGLKRAFDYLDIKSYSDAGVQRHSEMIKDAYFLLLKELEAQQWVSVEDRLPEEVDTETWVWGEGMEEPETDVWEGDRGRQAVAYLAENSRVEYVKSGWWSNDMQHITHWMPIDVPEPPREDNDG